MGSMARIDAPLNVERRAVAVTTLLLSLTLIAFVLQQPAMLICGTLLCAAYALLKNIHSNIHLRQLIVFVTISALFLPAFMKSYFGLTPEFYFLSMIATFFAASAITKYHPKVLLTAFKIIYTASIALIALALYVYWDLPEPLGEVIEGSSTNGIPAYLIIIQVGLSLCTYLVVGRLPLISALLTVAVAFFGYGRGSLVVAGIILALSIGFNIFQVHTANHAKLSLILLIISFIVIALVGSVEELIDFLFDYTKLGAGLVDVNRLEIWEQYLEKIDAWTLLVGADYSGTVIETLRAGNPHISYIRTHAFFGLPATIAALLSPLVVFISNKSFRSKLIFSSFIGMAALRAASEPILFPTLLDLFYFSYFFLFFRYAPAVRSSEFKLNHSAVLP
jgi:hypothetical protein